jgi:hypothetical protein
MLSTDGFVSEKLEAVALVANQFRRNEALRVFLNREEASSAHYRRNAFLIFSYPDRYVAALVESLIHPDWHVACFSSKCTNASMWSTYGDDHQGAALMFRVEHGRDGRPYLPVEGVTAVSSSRGRSDDRYSRGPVTGHLYKVNYDAKAPEIEFFQYLGRLPEGKLMKSWYASRSGQHSSIVQKVFDNEQSWRQALWKRFYEMATTKLPDWEHESEFRMVLPDQIGLRRAERRLTFDLSQLAGVVFGMKTRTEHKLEIMSRLTRKLKLRNIAKFSFFEL